MSVTVDANVLLYASDLSSSRQAHAAELLTSLAAGPQLLYLFWPVVSAYLRVATHPSIFERPLPASAARQNVGALVSRAHVRTPGEDEGFWSHFEPTLRAGTVRGNLVTDAHIVALMRQHGVSTIWSADQDFRRFPGIALRDPFAGLA